MTLARLMTAMTQTDFYPQRPQQVDLVQTHISLVFIAGDDVYKIKKPVDFGFLDFTTLEKRKFYCDEELRLNRRLAPSIYLDVVPITESAQGTPSLGGPGKIIDYAVHMKKLPADRMLKILLKHNLTQAGTMDAVAKRIASFHKEAQTGGKIDEMGAISTIRHNCEENFSQTAKYVDVTIPAYQHQFIRTYDEKFLEINAALLDHRVADHRIRDGHGDLHLEHICIDKDILVFDCIEFNERFRFADVAAEVAFLTMDLDFNGYAQEAKDFAASYLKYSGDVDMQTLLNFYRCYYAFVRGKVTSFRLDQKELPDSERATIQTMATRYFDLAYTYAARLEKPALILTAGTIGSGKSYQARHLAARLGAEVLRSDVLRKELLNITPGEKHQDAFGEGLYASDMSRRTYDRAFELANAEISQGRPVIIDASFSHRADRALAAHLAGMRSIPYYFIECVCPDDIVKTRLEKRKKEQDNPSDGRWEILQEQKKHYEEINDIPRSSYFKVDTAANPEQSRQEIIQTIRMADLLTKNK